MRSSLKDTTRHIEQALRELTVAIRMAGAFSFDHQLVAEHISTAFSSLEKTLEERQMLQVVAENGSLFYESTLLLPRVEVGTKLAEWLEERGVTVITFKQGLSREELSEFVRVGTAFRGGTSIADFSRALGLSGVAHIELSSILKPGLEVPQELTDLYKLAIEMIKGTFSKLANHGEFDLAVMNELATLLTNAVLEDYKSLFQVIVGLRTFDDHTYAHSVNVAILSVALTSTSTRDAKFLKEIARAALLHDTGKLRVPLTILNKKGGLSLDEWQVLRSHPVEGAQMLDRVISGDSLIPIVCFEHHCQHDLSGYPRLTRKRPNPYSLLISVADGFAAMSSDRPYRPALSPEETLRVMKRLVQTVYDPIIFRRFEQLMKRSLGLSAED